jgi:predicted anti-sigma-YlaC factor YlaD
MQHKHTLKELQLICQQFGEDIDSEICEEVKKSLKDCPECRVHFDSIKKVGYFYKVIVTEQNIPEDITANLFMSLNLK